MKLLLTLILTFTAALATAAGSREDIEIVFDRHKGGLFAEYVRAQRANPQLAGTIDFEIDIAKTGEVTGCRVRSSTLGDPDLERRLCARISAMKFSPRASPITVPKKVSFFPR